MDDKYIFGLVGILLGTFLNVGKELYAEKRIRKREAEYLAIRIVCILESFLEGCACVVSDDGLCHGQPDADGYSRPQVSRPDLEFEIKDANWKSLSSDLMYEVLNFPAQVSDANNFIDSTFEHAANPPDFDEGFEERQFQYSKLGLKAVDLSARIRTKYKLPHREISDWDIVDFVRSENKKIIDLRDVREKAHAKLFKQKAV